MTGLMLYAQDEALHYREISMDNNASAEGLQVLALSIIVILILQMPGPLFWQRWYQKARR